MGLSSLFLLLLLVFGPVNIEQYHHSYPASLDFYKSLFHGRFAFWSDGFGFGTPLPLGENFNFHPLFLLAVFLPLRLLFSIFWLTHLTLGAVYFLRLCRRLKIGGPTRLCLLFSYVFSVATVNYSYLNDWPAIFLAWTLFPVLVFYLDDFIEVGARDAPWFGVARLALLFGFCVLNTHVGYFVVLCIVLLVFVLVRSRLRPRVIALLCVAAIAILCLIAERAYFILSEMRYFPDYSERKSQEPYSVGDWIHHLYRPMSGELVNAVLDGDKDRMSAAYLDIPERLRIPFLGTVVLIAASAAAISLFSWRPGRWSRDDLFAASALCFLFSFALSIIPSDYLLKLPSGMWLFRDTAILFGLLSAGRGLTWLAARPGKRVWLKPILVLQCAQLTLAMIPGMLVVYRHRDVGTQFYNGRHEETFARWLDERAGSLGSRIYLSPRITKGLRSERGVYASVGLLGTGDFNRLGLEPVNGYFKGVSMHLLHPPLHLMMSLIPSDSAIIQSKSVFDVLGIDFLLIQAREITQIGARDLARLETLGTFSVPDLKEPFVLMHNPSAWPRAVFYQPAVTKVTLDQMGCRGPALLLCNDLSVLERLRLPEPLRMQGRNGSFTLTMESTDRDRIATVSTLYRREWRAFDEDGDDLATLPVANALLGIEVPAGTGEVSVRFDPRWRRRLLVLQIVAAIVCLAFVARGPGAPDAGSI